MAFYANNLTIISGISLKFHTLFYKCDDILCANVTGFWKISPNATFYNSNVYIQNKKWELPINLTVVTICSSHLELPESNRKYFKKLCNPFAVVTINCVIQCDIKTDFTKNRITNITVKHYPETKL